jgi:hypothetical protein
VTVRALACLVAAVVVVVAACTPPNQRVELREVPDYPDEPKTVSVLGDWVLATPADSTVFIGANQVEMQIGMSDFTIRARYPGRSDVLITGDVATDGTAGPLQLIPRSVVAPTATGAPPVAIAVGTPIALIAGAAGQTLVFGTIDPGAPPNPTSVWHRREAARAAGMIEAAGSVEPETKKRP